MTGFSSKVRLLLNIGNQWLRVRQVGEGSLILREPDKIASIACRACCIKATVVIEVDGTSHEYPVVIRYADRQGVVRFDDDVSDQQGTQP